MPGLKGTRARSGTGASRSAVRSTKEYRSDRKEDVWGFTNCVNTKGARATTVHRLLGYQSRGALGASAAAAANGAPADGAGDANDAAGSGLVPGVFTYREGNPLEVDAVLVRIWGKLPAMVCLMLGAISESTGNQA